MPGVTPRVQRACWVSACIMALLLAWGAISVAMTRAEARRSDALLGQVILTLDRYRHSEDPRFPASAAQRSQILERCHAGRHPGDKPITASRIIGTQAVPGEPQLIRVVARVSSEWGHGLLVCDIDPADHNRVQRRAMAIPLDVDGFS